MLGLSVYHHELEALRRGSYEAIKTIKIPHCHHVSPRIYIAAVLPRTSFIKVLSGNQINLVLVLGGGKTSGKELIIPFIGRSVRQTFLSHVRAFVILSTVGNHRIILQRNH